LKLFIKDRLRKVRDEFRLGAGLTRLILSGRISVIHPDDTVIAATNFTTGVGGWERDRATTSKRDDLPH
jgi:hypothetical protein